MPLFEVLNPAPGLHQVIIDRSRKMESNFLRLLANPIRGWRDMGSFIEGQYWTGRNYSPGIRVQRPDYDVIADMIDQFPGATMGRLLLLVSARTGSKLENQFLVIVDSGFVGNVQMSTEGPRLRWEDLSLILFELTKKL